MRPFNTSDGDDYLMLLWVTVLNMAVWATIGFFIPTLQTVGWIVVVWSLGWMLPFFAFGAAHALWSIRDTIARDLRYSRLGRLVRWARS